MPSRRDVLKAAVVLAAGCTPSVPHPPPRPRPAPSLRLPDGQLLGPSASPLLNPRFDSLPKPVAVARCVSVADVQACVRWATETGTPLHVRSGGHSYGGWSSGPGLVVDLRSLSSVGVSGSTARIGGGALLAPVYSSLASRGVALAAGSCPTVGLSGLGLGGGVGVLSRAFGLTCDAFQGASVVTASGAVVSADPDLLWALRGGGGSFGIVTSWDCAVRPAPTVVTFYVSWDLSHGAEVLDAWQHWAPYADPRLWSTCKLLTSPSRDRALIAGTWIGDPAALSSALSPLSSLGTPRARVVRTRAYGDAMLFEAGCAGLTTQSCVSHGFATHQAFSATSVILRHSLPSLSPVVAAVREAPAGLIEGGLSFDALGGQVAAGPDSAIPWRDALATVQATATFGGGSPAAFDAYTHGLRSLLAPWTGASAYSNYADPSITDYGTAYWGSRYPRLQEVKRTYDPHDLFRWPQSVRLPAA